MLAALREADREPTAGEQELLGRWTSWGAVPSVFDEARDEHQAVRERLAELVDPAALAPARATVLNAHYTDPRYARAMWDAVQDLGFTSGPVLEPGCGSGIFMATAPAGAQMVGVELDPTTAEIAARLNPAAEVRAESFADSRFDQRFAAVIGNVPFANRLNLHDPLDNASGHSIHNHFVIKGLANTAPGGVVAVLASRFVLDATNPAARREMAAYGALVGAVRLPAGAHRRLAGTDVVTDVLVFQRHLNEAPEEEPSWVKTTLVDVDGAELAVNRHFVDHPGRVLGTYAHDPFPGPGLDVRTTAALEEIPEQLQQQLRAIVDGALQRGQRVPDTLDLSPRTDTARRPARATEGQHWDGHLAIDGDGFTIQRDGRPERHPVPATQRGELRALLELRDRARDLVLAEAASPDDDPQLEVERQALAGAYEAYTGRYGALNRFTTNATGHVDPETGETRLRRLVPPAIRTIRSDPFGPLVLALEVYDESTQTAQPASLLRERAIRPRPQVLGTDDPDEAIAICLDRRGAVDLETIAELLGRDPAEARQALGDRVFMDPDEDRLVAAAEYLSGNVRIKLETVQALADERPELGANVAALQAVIPQDIGLDEIEPRMGAVWIDAQTHQAFLRQILDNPSLKVEHPGGSTWGVAGRRFGVAATSEWGTERVPAPKLAQLVMEQRQVQVFDTDPDGRRIFNPTESAAAQDKAEALQERFAEWVWEDSDRAARLSREYNHRFNSIVLRDYSAAGERLTFPGLVSSFEPRPHQRAAVARMLSEPAAGLFHEVGAGKTAEMIIGSMELRRLGMVSKPCVVVPNHMLEQFSREWLQLYPQARLLAASSKEVTKDNRRAFVARAATHDWDAVVMTRSAFERLPLTAEREAVFRGRELRAMEAQLEHAREGSGLTVKRLAGALQRQREKLKAQQDRPVDPGLTFEASGIDYLVIDEMHEYKNLITVSAIPGAAIAGSKRALDLAGKLDYLRDTHGDRVITAATATPIANSVTEAHVMQRFLRPDLLQAAGVDNFDAWAATFGRTVTEIEMSPDGGSFRQKTRFAKFQNVPEMLRLWHTFGDVKTADDLQLPRPDLLPTPEGKPGPETIVIPAAPELLAYVASLGDRADKVRGGLVDPTEDNMLKISSDGRKAALDMRLVDGTTSDPESTKLNVAAVRIATIWRQHRDRIYTDPQTGEPSATPGALQLVFCDLGTPSESWNAYDELRRLLVDQGLPAEQVRFIHEARNDAEKGRLFAAARSGDIAVLIGSTQKMGVGTNIQARAVALHHLDCPWRPADIQQRDGRVLRQGNQNAEVGIHRYVVEGSFDGFSWQTVERKMRFITQVMRGDESIRNLDDIGDDALSYAEVKALASGNPLLLEKAAADTELQRLTRLDRAHGRNQTVLQTTRQTELQYAQLADQRADGLDAAAASAVSTRGDAFAIEISGQRFTDRPAAAAALGDVVSDAARAQYGRPGDLGAVASIGGFTVHAKLQSYAASGPAIAFTLDGVPAEPTTTDLKQGRMNGGAALRGLETRVNGLEDLAARARSDANAHRATAQKARDQLGKPFKHAAALAVTRERVDEINRQLAQTTLTPDTPERAAEANDQAVDVDELRRLRQASQPASPGTAGPQRGTDAPPRAPHKPDAGPSFER